ncbi:MAG: aspartate/glutamate racemase family protein [Comamonadaceae bacterium]|nr:MAG: aspartate/glutamate racemase family protein [Comamonadaceae bacterium]
MRQHPAAVGILGGMGPAAGADFVRLFVEACTELLRARGVPVTDQAYPEHWLAQVPVPDRSTALRIAADMPARPLEAMKQVAARLGALGARTLAIACNTAHAWHGALQASFPELEVIHGVREVATALARRGVREAGLLATEGTYGSGVYQRELEAAGLRCHVPMAAEQQLLMEGIYRGVKAGDIPLAQARFEAVARALSQRHGAATLILGCTEIPLALRPGAATVGLELVDPAQLIARALAARAYGVAAGWSDPRSAG